MMLGRHIALLEADTNAVALGSLTDQEISSLLSWLPDKGTFVEFGTLFGLTAKTVAAAKPSLKIVTVDNFSWNPFGLTPNLHETFTRKILANEVATGQIEIIKSTSEAYRAKCESAPDAVFFDASHQYDSVKAEIEWAKLLGVKCICGHDYGNSSPIFGVTQAVNESFPKGVDIGGMCWRAR